MTSTEKATVAQTENAVSSTSSAPDGSTVKVPPKVFPSPFQVTRVRDQPEPENADAVALEDILGDPLISECWNFNFLHDIDFLLDAFDKDVRDMVRVHVVHGFWKREDLGRLMLQVSSLI